MRSRPTAGPCPAAGSRPIAGSLPAVLRALKMRMLRLAAAALCLAAAALCLAVAALCSAVAGATAPNEPAAPASASARIEARSATLLAVGIVQEDRLSIHLSRLVDNAPVRDAVLTVLLRGVVHPTIAEADGSYTVKTPDLKLPGTAAVTFEVVRNAVHDSLKGSLQNATSETKTEDKNSSRQLAWWVLNFAVCIGFLMLISRRRKTAKAQDSL